MLQYENELLKEDDRALREEMERWKEARKKKVAWGLDTLVEFAIQFENPPYTQEKEVLICTECRVLFKLVGYKVDKLEIAYWRLEHLGQGGDETLNEEPT